MADVRVGLGFDVHSWTAGRDLMLGGVRFDGHDGLVGHSDGDVVCHAIADALLGAAALGDLGEHFPENDRAIMGIAGVELLGRTCTLVRDAGYRPVSCDVTVVCVEPAIAPRRDEMRAALASALGLWVGAVSVKATRPEGLGLQGDGAGCLATVLVERR